MVAVPLAIPVSRPAPSIVATEGVLLVQVPVPASVVSVVVAPIHNEVVPNMLPVAGDTEATRVAAQPVGKV